DQPDPSLVRHATTIGSNYPTFHKSDRSRRNLPSTRTMGDDLHMLDTIDRALIHALQLDGRAAYSRIGEVLGVSTQTVARRFNRLRAEADLRVIGLPDPQTAGRALWLVRLTATPQVAQDLAAALAR